MKVFVFFHKNVFRTSPPTPLALLQGPLGPVWPPDKSIHIEAEYTMFSHCIRSRLKHSFIPTPLPKGPLRVGVSDKWELM
jgi:hypothetical protein